MIISARRIIYTNEKRIEWIRSPMVEKDDGDG